MDCGPNESTMNEVSSSSSTSSSSCYSLISAAAAAAAAAAVRYTHVVRFDGRPHTCKVAHLLHDI